MVENGIASEPASEERQMDGLEVMQPLFPCDGSSAQKISQRPEQQSEPEDAELEPPAEVNEEEEMGDDHMPEEEVNDDNLEDQDDEVEEQEEA